MTTTDTRAVPDTVQQDIDELARADTLRAPLVALLALPLVQLQARGRALARLAVDGADERTMLADAAVRVALTLRRAAEEAPPARRWQVTHRDEHAPVRSTWSAAAADLKALLHDRMAEEAARDDDLYCLQQAQAGLVQLADAAATGTPVRVAVGPDHYELTPVR